MHFSLPSFLDDVGTAGERAQQYLELLHKLSDDSSGKWKSYLAMRGVLPRIGRLITQEIDHLLVLEETTLSSDLSQGYALKMLTGWCVLCPHGWHFCMLGSWLDYRSLVSQIQPALSHISDYYFLHTNMKF